MAYTSLLPVHRLDNSIRYIRDGKKITKQGNPADSAGSLEEAIGYALNRDKTEDTLFEDAIGCTCSDAFLDMSATKKRFHKTEGVQGYHLIQSFAEGEVTPELAHLIGVEFAEQLLKGRYEAVVTTHLNTNHYHNHIVFNSVSMTDGRKYHSNSRSYYGDVRKLSDSLCRKYGLSIIENPEGKGMTYGQWQAEKEGKPTWRTAIRLDIREAVKECFTWKQFLSFMEQKGYTWKLNRKYISLKAPGMERFVRLKSLGKNYSEESIREWILKPKQFATRGADGRKGKESQTPKPKLSGLQALYYSYLYQMGVLKHRPKRVSSLVRQDIRKLEQRIAQMEFLQKHDITTREQLMDYRRPLEEEVLSLTKERHGLYRKEPESERIKEIGERLKPLRQEVKMCVRIEQHSREIEKRLLEEAQRKQEQENRQETRRKDQEQERR